MDEESPYEAKSYKQQPTVLLHYQVCEKPSNSIPSTSEGIQPSAAENCTSPYEGLIVMQYEEIGLPYHGISSLNSEQVHLTNMENNSRNYNNDVISEMHSEEQTDEIRSSYNNSSTVDSDQILYQT